LNGIFPSRIHDLPVLLNKCIKINKNFVDFIDDLKYLNKFYIASKYPIDPPIIFSRQETKKVIDITNNTIKQINATNKCS